jgi:hypothetical protein
MEKRYNAQIAIIFPAVTNGSYERGLSKQVEMGKNGPQGPARQSRCVNHYGGIVAVYRRSFDFTGTFADKIADGIIAVILTG